MRQIGRIVVRIHKFLRNKISDVAEIFCIVGEFCLVEERTEIIWHFGGRIVDSRWSLRKLHRGNNYSHRSSFWFYARFCKHCNYHRSYIQRPCETEISARLFKQLRGLDKSSRRRVKSLMTRDFYIVWSFLYFLSSNSLRITCKVYQKFKQISTTDFWK